VRLRFAAAPVGLGVPHARTQVAMVMFDTNIVEALFRRLGVVVRPDAETGFGPLALIKPGCDIWVAAVQSDSMPRSFFTNGVQLALPISRSAAFVCAISGPASLD